MIFFYKIIVIRLNKEEIHKIIINRKIYIEKSDAFITF